MRNIRKDKGSSLIEFAIIAPLIFLLIAGVIQFGFIFNAKIAVNAASFEGARAAALSEEPEEDAKRAVYYYANSTLPGWSFDERLGMFIDFQGYNPGDVVSVKVNYKVPVFFGNIISFGGNDVFNIQAESCMSIEEKE